MRGNGLHTQLIILNSRVNALTCFDIAPKQAFWAFTLTPELQHSIVVEWSVALSKNDAFFDMDTVSSQRSALLLSKHYSKSWRAVDLIQHQCRTTRIFLHVWWETLHSSPHISLVCAPGIVCVYIGLFNRYCIDYSQKNMCRTKMLRKCKDTQLVCTEVASNTYRDH